MRPLTYRHVALGANTSDRTGAPYFVGDLRQLTISIVSSTGSASRYTVVGTNDDGLRSALGTPSPLVPSGGWSIATVLTGQGLYAFDPTVGFRWINVYRDAVSVSAASNCTITLAGRT